jgi:hypothetical protein
MLHDGDPSQVLCRKASIDANLHANRQDHLELQQTKTTDTVQALQKVHVAGVSSYHASKIAIAVTSTAV